jgi:hypothetical protein
VWSDQVFLAGGLCMRRPIPVDFADVVVATGVAIGYTDGNLPGTSEAVRTGRGCS